MDILNWTFAFVVPGYVVGVFTWKRWKPYAERWYLITRNKYLEVRKPPHRIEQFVAELETGHVEEEDEVDIEVERIMSLPDEEVLQETIEADEDPEETATSMLALFERVKAEGARPPLAGDWIDTFLSTVIHAMVLGGTGSGKTKLLQLFAERLVRSEQQVIVCDPDAAKGDWPNTQLWGAGDQFDQIDSALRSVAAVARERREARAEGTRTFDPLWLILEEYADIKDECPEAGTIVENLLRRARKLNIHVLIGVQDSQVKTLGFERKSHLLTNVQQLVVRVDLEGRRRVTIDERSYRIPEIPDRENNTPVGPVSVQNPGKIDDPDETVVEIPDEDETEPDVGKDDAIRSLLSLGWSYGRITRSLNVSTSRVARIVKESRLED